MTLPTKRIGLLLITASLLACCQQPENPDEAAAAEESITPVTVAHPSHQTMSESVNVNAVSAFLLKTYVKANTNGYLQEVNARMGDYVSRGQKLFVIKTKEAEALGSTISNLDSSLHFTGTLLVKAPASGFITQLAYTSGNYVQDGEQLAEIADNRNFAFLLDLPYELKPYLAENHRLELRLPDQTILQGTVEMAMPRVDSVSQTQRFVIRVQSKQMIPENLVATVRLSKAQKPGATTLPKQAVLSNETQQQYWIMQVINDSTAVKRPVQLGLREGDRVEILHPALGDSDRIIVTGNYGLPDTARIRITATNQNPVN